jgi:hypothetical protein
MPALIVQDDIQERAMYFHRSVVFNETHFPEFVHEETDPWARSSDHQRQCLLADLCTSSTALLLSLRSREPADMPRAKVMRIVCVVRHSSPKKSCGPGMAIKASLPSQETTATLIFPE